MTRRHARLVAVLAFIAAGLILLAGWAYPATWPPGPGAFTDCGINGRLYPVRFDVTGTDLASLRLRYGPCFAGAQLEGCDDNQASTCPRVDPKHPPRRCIPEEYEGGWASNWFTRELGRFPTPAEVDEVGVICDAAAAMQRDNLIADPLPTPTVPSPPAPTPAPTTPPVVECPNCPPPCPPPVPLVEVPVPALDCLDAIAALRGPLASWGGGRRRCIAAVLAWLREVRVEPVYRSTGGVGWCLDAAVGATREGE